MTTIKKTKKVSNFTQLIESEKANYGEDVEDCEEELLLLEEDNRDKSPQPCVDGEFCFDVVKQREESFESSVTEVRSTSSSSSSVKIKEVKEVNEMKKQQVKVSGTETKHQQQEKETKHQQVQQEKETKQQVQENGLQESSKLRKELTKESQVFASVSVKELRLSFGNFSTTNNKNGRSKSVECFKSFSKFDKLQKKISRSDSLETKKTCQICTKEVFLVELIKAEKSNYHKNCFRCSVEDCRKQLGVDSYSSHEGKLYCKPHHRSILMPKPVLEEEIAFTKEKQKSVVENEPVQLPEGIVRASDVLPDPVLDLDLRSKFELFEGLKNNSEERKLVEPPVKRSPSVLAKLSKFESNSNGIENSELGPFPSEISDEEEADPVPLKLKTPTQAIQELLQHKNLEQVRKNWEKGQMDVKEEMAEQRKSDMARFRSRLCHGKSNQLKERYEKGLFDHEEDTDNKNDDKMQELESLRLEKATKLKEMFERGFDEDQTKESRQIELFELFENEDFKKSREIFKGIDERCMNGSGGDVDEGKKQEPPLKKIDKEKFDFFEHAHDDHDPETKSQDPDLKRSKTTSKMLNKFKQMEERLHEENSNKIKPLKEFTPPRDDGVVGRRMTCDDSDDEKSQDLDDDHDHDHQGEIVNNGEDVFLKEVGSLARARSLRAKFEKWEQSENTKNEVKLSENEDSSSIESARILKEKFEQLHDSCNEPKKREHVHVRRFV